MLFEHFEGRLEYHAPWHHGRVLSHLFRGKVDVDEANALLGEHGDDDLRLLDNGAIGRPMAAVEGRTHAYHLVPRQVSKAAAVAAHARARGYDPADCIAVGDSVEDLEVAAAVGRFFVVANGPERDPGLRAELGELGQRHRHRGRDGRRLLRGGRLDPGRAAAKRPATRRPALWALDLDVPAPNVGAQRRPLPRARCASRPSRVRKTANHGPIQPGDARSASVVVAASRRAAISCTLSPTMHEQARRPSVTPGEDRHPLVVELPVGDEADAADHQRSGRGRSRRRRVTAPAP